MKSGTLYLLTVGLGTLLFVQGARAQNPLITDQFSADPTARVFEGRVYVYPSHDIPAGPGRGRAGWFVMEDYHVFSSENLTDWTDHGVILTQTDVPWLERKSFDMWAPDCVAKDGKYYLYFPTGGRIGVAVAEKPYGPFKPEAKPIEGARGIDPCVLVDKDGKAYLYSSMNRIFVGQLKDNMRELDSGQQVIANLPQKGLIEGPFVFERNGIYYLTYPHVNNKTERLEYATGAGPMGPFEHKGVIMDESPSGCWTNHHSIVQYQGQWYLFYHDQDLSPNFDKNRAIKADSLFFNEDGTIQKVTPTLRGVGVTDARREIQMDRYSAVSPEGASIAFLNPQDRHKGWKTILTARNAWVQYNKVDFGDQALHSVKIRASAAVASNIAVRMDTSDGPLIARVAVPQGTDWIVADSTLATIPSGLHNVVVALDDADGVEIDWVRFE